jgi:hypothetical protein
MVSVLAALAVAALAANVCAAQLQLVAAVSVQRQLLLSATAAAEDAVADAAFVTAAVPTAADLLDSVELKGETKKTLHLTATVKSSFPA